MTNVRKLPVVDDPVVEEAAAWITKLDRGLSDAEEAELARWLAASRANEREFMASAKQWDRMEGMSRLADIFPEPEMQAPKSVRQSWLGWRAAALLAVCAGIGWLAWQHDAYKVLSDDVVAVADTAHSSGRYETAIGEQSVFDLSDGSRIVLNTNSLVTVNYTDHNRLLRLERGEVHVKVAHDPRALSVVVGEKIIQAVGTEFNLEITSDQNVELVVTDGVVMIGVLDAPIDELPGDQPVILQPSSTLVAAGQETEIDTKDAVSTEVEKKEIRAEEIAVRLSWRNGNLIFRGESLEDAVTEIGRYTAVEFVFLDENAKKIKLLGMYKAGDVDSLLAALRANFNITYERVGDNKILLSANE